MNTMKKIAVLFFVAATLFATSCGKDDTNNTNNTGSDSLTGTTWRAGETTGEWATIQFTSSTAVTYTEGLREEYVSFNGTYTYTAPNGTIHIVTEEDPMDGHFTVNGSSLYVSELDLTFIRQ